MNDTYTGEVWHTYRLHWMSDEFWNELTKAVSETIETMCDDERAEMSNLECPRHEGAFDCSPFCEVCEGAQEYDPKELDAEND